MTVVGDQAGGEGEARAERIDGAAETGKGASEETGVTLRLVSRRGVRSAQGAHLEVEMLRVKWSNVPIMHFAQNIPLFHFLPLADGWTNVQVTRDIAVAMVHRHIATVICTERADAHDYAALGGQDVSAQRSRQVHAPMNVGVAGIFAVQARQRVRRGQWVAPVLVFGSL